MEQLMRQLEMHVMLGNQLTSWGMIRTDLLYKFQLSFLANKYGDKLTDYYMETLILCVCTYDSLSVLGTLMRTISEKNCSNLPKILSVLI